MRRCGARATRAARGSGSTGACRSATRMSACSARRWRPTATTPPVSTSGRAPARCSRAPTKVTAGRRSRAISRRSRRSRSPSSTDGRPAPPDDADAVVHRVAAPGRRRRGNRRRCDRGPRPAMAGAPRSPLRDRAGAEPAHPRLCRSRTRDARNGARRAFARRRDRGDQRRRALMRKLQSQGVHHVTLVGADRRTSIDFWEGVLGMPFVFEQPNLDNEGESHLYFDPGDGRLITVFTDEGRTGTPDRTPTDPGCVHHLAFAVSQAMFMQAVERLGEAGTRHSGPKDRGFMDSIYFTDPLGLLIELASYRFEPPAGFSHGEVLLEAHKLRVERGDYNIAPIHLADAIEILVARSRESLSSDRSPKDPYS